MTNSQIHQIGCVPAAAILFIIGLALGPEIRKGLDNLSEWGQRPRINETKNGRTIGDSSGFSRYEGTDFNRDGNLDEVHAYFGGGRCGWGTKEKFAKNDVPYKQLQQKYTRALCSNHR